MKYMMRWESNNFDDMGALISRTPPLSSVEANTDVIHNQIEKSSQSRFSVIIPPHLKYQIVPRISFVNSLHIEMEAFDWKAVVDT